MNDGLKQRGKSARSDEWQTPPWLVKALDSEFGFTFDAAANEENAVCKRFSNDIERSLVLPEPDQPVMADDRIFCNPPYSNIEVFIRLALKTPNLWVFVLPAFSDKIWYRLLLESPRCSYRPFVKRIKFFENGAPAKNEDGTEGSPFFGTQIWIIRPV